MDRRIALSTDCMGAVVVDAARIIYLNRLETITQWVGPKFVVNVLLVVLIHFSLVPTDT